MAQRFMGLSSQSDPSVLQTMIAQLDTILAQPEHNMALVTELNNLKHEYQRCLHEAQQRCADKQRRKQETELDPYKLVDGQQQRRRTAA
eukprot:CAMPEP_0202703518 /NCGR_PEP_ID=MMETSP1385-20130828/16361_1 /ASSEMBLY_ACC=CAM_ASM_000861 /TAXON_ID=933848 /ORGANISM="Elphidium margaritaceum" /LENGTH=88 /DNA_ID=CAMNT_0049361387 /DNA_START=16 /DNA_END=278 /DNA_ORIENTATION=-